MLGQFRFDFNSLMTIGLIFLFFIHPAGPTGATYLSTTNSALTGARMIMTRIAATTGSSSITITALESATTESLTGASSAVLHSPRQMG